MFVAAVLKAAFSIHMLVLLIGFYMRLKGKRGLFPYE